MRGQFKILLFILPVLVLIIGIIALSRWEIPAPSTEMKKSLSTDKVFMKKK